MNVRDARRLLREADQDELLTVGFLAIVWGVSQKTVRKWIREGLLSTTRLGTTRNVRVRAWVAREFERDQQLSA